MLDIFALIVIAVVAAAAIWLIVMIAGIPGKLARAADHPYATAITYLGWIGLVTGGLAWFAGLVWSQVQPDTALQRRVDELEQKVRAMEESA